MASVKSNILLNGINTVTGIIFPVITFPYAARVLLPEGIGIINFLNSIINYIVLLTSLGIPLYAVKEVAKYRDDKENRDKITIEVIILSSILCFLGYIGVWILARYVPQIHEQSSLFFVLSLSILFTSIGVNWFYQGIENFKFITIRAIIIRTLSAAALFIFVKDSSDILIYGFIVVGSTVGNNFINFFYLHNYISINNIKNQKLKILRHLKPAFQVFVLNLIISLYMQLNSVMLGFMSGDDAVGYYTAGTRISHIGLSIITSLGTVLLPQCSHLIKSGNTERFKSIINKSLNLTLGMTLPIALGLIILSKPITLIFCGNNYGEAIPVLWFSAPLIIFASLSNLFAIQILYPLDKTNLVIVCVSSGAIINIIINILIIPYYGATGASISALLAEISVLVAVCVLGKKYFPFRLSQLINIKYLISTLVMGIIITIFDGLVSLYITKVTLCACIGSISYLICLKLLKEPLFMELLKTIKLKKKYI